MVLKEPKYVEIPSRNSIADQVEITSEAIKNAIKLDMAVAASSNLILHIPAIAHEAGYELPWWKYFDEASMLK